MDALTIAILVLAVGAIVALGTLWWFDRYSDKISRGDRR